MGKFKIKKVGNNYVAFDLNDKKKTYGKININTGKFIGDTSCYLELFEYYKGKKDELLNKVVNQIKSDIANGDVTAIHELLGYLPNKYLEGFLPFY